MSYSFYLFLLINFLFFSLSLTSSSPLSISSSIVKNYNTKINPILAISLIQIKKNDQNQKENNLKINKEKNSASLPTKSNVKSNKKSINFSTKSSIPSTINLNSTKPLSSPSSSSNIAKEVKKKKEKIQRKKILTKKNSFIIPTFVIATLNAIKKLILKIFLLLSQLFKFFYDKIVEINLQNKEKKLFEDELRRSKTLKRFFNFSNNNLVTFYMNYYREICKDKEELEQERTNHEKSSNKKSKKKANLSKNKDKTKKKLSKIEKEINAINKLTSISSSSFNQKDLAMIIEEKLKNFDRFKYNSPYFRKLHEISKKF